METITKRHLVLTHAQQWRLGDLLLRDLREGAIPPAASLDLPPVPRPDRRGVMIDKMLDEIERKQNERTAAIDREARQITEEMFSREELFRIAYVPFVIAELVWDYADTVIIMARQLHDPAVRRLSRAIRQARADYDRLRHHYIDDAHRAGEIDNGYIFEDATRHITSQMMLNVRLDITQEYPDLGDGSRDLLLAVYQCHVISRALLLYIDRQSEYVARRVGHPIGKMLPPSYYLMDSLIPEYIGDKPASARLRDQMDKYINTFATQIALVTLTDIKDNDKRTD